ncbi:MAG: glycosyltransferase, partial [Rhizobiales bacterium]|nr:glycosyltransferase [Hyphomicrobiales bacterium]
EGILFAVVSRLTWQKGMELLGECLDGLVAEGMRLAILGSGEAALEGMFHAAANRHRGRIGFQTAFDEPLSHLIQGGADAILVPSRFEPCGLTQFYGLRYGCVPVVARVGGLADTIIDANDAALSAGVATGLQFFPVDAPSLDRAIKRAADLYRQPATWQMLQKRGMKSDVSWDKSAARYADLYRQLAGGRG